MKYTDKQFFDWEIEHGLYPGGHNKGFYEVHNKLAQFIIKYKPKLHADLGGGNSPLCKILQDNGIDTDLYELNKYSCYLQKEYGVKNVLNIDFISGLNFNEICKITLPYDFITCIEVFEHIENEKLCLFMLDLAYSCKYLIFSSTPHKDTPEFDEQWGHVNIKQIDEWIELFESNNFKLMQDETTHLQSNCIPTTWTLMFKSNICQNIL